MSLHPKYGGISVPVVEMVITAQNEAGKRDWFMVIPPGQLSFFKNVAGANVIYLADAAYINEKIIPNINNNFWKEILLWWSVYLNCCDNVKQSGEDMMSKSVWYNNEIKIDGKSIYFP